MKEITYYRQYPLGTLINDVVSDLEYVPLFKGNVKALASC